MTVFIILQPTKVRLLRNSSKNKYSKVIFSFLLLDSKDALFVILLNTVLKPTTRRKIKGQGTSSTYKITIKEAIDSCITHIRQINDLQRTREEKLNQQTSVKGTIQPYMLVVGEKLTQLVEFYVVVGETLFKFSSFLAAFEMCFKSFQVFDLKYPKESELFWVFIQKYIFDIETVHDIRSSILTEFMENLKNFQKEE